jgi:uncharacterized protein YodC (DUF2158 family)
MKHDYTNETIQAAINAACIETHKKHRSDIGSNLVIDTNAMPGAWESETRARLIAAASQDVQTADEPMTQAMSQKQISGTSWQPAVGDTVRLKSGAGFTMVIDAVNGPMASCEWHDATGQPQSRSYPAACLTPAKEDAR